jgi:hypothetical protein
MLKMPLVFTKRTDGSTVVTGDTFIHKEKIKILGGTWNPAVKAWILPPNADLKSLEPFTSQAPVCRPALPLRTEISPETPKPAVSKTSLPTLTSLISKALTQSTLTRRIPGKGTYDVKDEIKKAGGRWDAETKEWIVPMNFDDSIVPQQEPKVRASPRCSVCRSEEHRKDRCTYVCEKCGAQGQHNSSECPTTSLPKHGHRDVPIYVLGQYEKITKISCECGDKGLCWYCKNACCKEAYAYAEKLGRSMILCRKHFKVPLDEHRPEPKHEP